MGYNILILKKFGKSYSLRKKSQFQLILIVFPPHRLILVQRPYRLLNLGSLWGYFLV